MKLVKYKDIYFFESNIKDINIIKHITTKIDGFFTQSQLKNLDSVKENLYNQAKINNSNCIINFKYGQKQNSFLNSFFSLDDIYWFGEGDLVFLKEKEIKKYL